MELTCVWKSDVLMFFPTPVALRSYNAATTASTINRPAIRSVIATPGRHGSPSIKKKTIFEIWVYCSKFGRIYTGRDRNYCLTYSILLLVWNSINFFGLSSLLNEGISNFPKKKILIFIPPLGVFTFTTL